MEFTKESVFISALRAFLRTFAVLIGIAVALFVIGLGFSTMSNQVEVPEKSELKISPDADWNQSPLPSSSPVILRIDVSGIIGTKSMRTEKFKEMLIDSRSGMLSSDRVKGIILHVNTPGGSAVDSSGIHALLETYKEKYKVPVYAFVEGLCASGGMYISSAADKVFATADSTIGSVGVRLGPTFNFSAAMEKVGISSLTLTEGLNKDALNPFRPWKEGESDALQKVIAADYQQFVDAVTKSRKRLNREKLINEYGANVFIAAKAQELGYIDDGNASYDKALKQLAIAAGIKEDEKYQVILIKPYQSVLQELAENKMAFLRGKMKHVFPTGAFTTSEMSGQILYLYEPSL